MRSTTRSLIGQRLAAGRAVRRLSTVSDGKIVCWELYLERSGALHAAGLEG